MFKTKLFKVGDVVRLPSGNGPIMTVTKIKWFGKVKVCWCEVYGYFYYKVFPAKALIRKVL